MDYVSLSFWNGARTSGRSSCPGLVGDTARRRYSDAVAATGTREPPSARGLVAGSDEEDCDATTSRAARVPRTGGYSASSGATRTQNAPHLTPLRVWTRGLGVFCAILACCATGQPVAPQTQELGGSPAQTQSTMGAGATTLAETPKPDLELSQSDSLSTFDSLAQSSTLDRSMSMKQSWHASYMQRSRSAKINENDMPHKLAISFGGSGRTLLEDDDDWIAVEETHDFNDEKWERPKLRKGRLDESYRLTESGTILLRETTKITSTGFNDEDVSVVDRCVLLGPLGAGGGGRVHKALDLVGRRLVAVKAIPVHNQQKRRQLVAELKALRSTSTDDETHVIRILDCYAHAPSDAAWLVVEYADGGSVQDFVERGGTSNEKAIACLGRQVATGLKHVHGKGYAHRDVKPSNILLDRSGVAKLADFGIASQINNDASTRTFVGTAQYMSPERIRGDAYTTAADVWGLGVSLLAVVRGSAPFGGKQENEDAEYWRLVGEVVEAPAPSLPADWTADAKTCLEACLAKDAVERPTADELLGMPFFGEAPAPSPEYFFAGVALRDGRNELNVCLDAVADHLAERRAAGVARALFAAGGFDELARQFDLTSDDVEDAVRSRLGPRDAASPPDLGRRRPSRDDSARLTAELAKELDSPVPLSQCQKLPSP